MRTTCLSIEEPPLVYMNELHDQHPMSDEKYKSISIYMNRHENGKRGSDTINQRKLSVAGFAYFHSNICQEVVLVLVELRVSAFSKKEMRQ